MLGLLNELSTFARWHATEHHCTSEVLAWRVPWSLSCIDLPYPSPGMVAVERTSRMWCSQVTKRRSWSHRACHARLLGSHSTECLLTCSSNHLTEQFLIRSSHQSWRYYRLWGIYLQTSDLDAWYAMSGELLHRGTFEQESWRWPLPKTSSLAPACFLLGTINHRHWRTP